MEAFHSAVACLLARLSQLGNVDRAVTIVCEDPDQEASHIDATPKEQNGWLHRSGLHGGVKLCPANRTE